MSSAVVSDIDAFWDKACSSVKDAVEQHVPLQTMRPNRPRISPETMQLLQQRCAARIHGHWDVEKRLRSQVKKSVKEDKAKWLEDLASSGDWKSIKKLRRGRSVKQGRLRNTDGELVSSELRVETLAAHLERIQWRVRLQLWLPMTRYPLVLRFQCTWATSR